MSLQQTSSDGDCQMPDPVRLVHITPELPPAIGGVADYTAILSRRLVEVSNGSVEPVLVHAGHQPTEVINVNFPVEDLSGQCSAMALADTIGRLADEVNGQAVVLLEYSGYGYATRGAPQWLGQALREACNEYLPLITFFHELYASTWKPWSSTFWLSALQKRVARSIARHSRALLTNHSSSADRLDTFVHGSSPLRIQPIFSNVGELATRPEMGDRDPLAVVFGGSSEKAALYAQTRRLRSLFEHGGIDQLVDVGPEPDRVPDLGVSVEIQGTQPAEAVSQVLRQARIGLAHRRLDLLTKSGVVAAYLAHGVPPVILPRTPSSASPLLSEGAHFLRLEHAATSTMDWDHLSRSGFAWYQEHANSREAARILLDFVRTEAPVC